jgi:DNA polymerase-1
MTGRERIIPDMNSKNPVLRNAAERLAINTPLQGSAADLIKQAMLNADARLHKEQMLSFMVLQIHDELLFETPDFELIHLQSLAKEVMESVFTLKVPLKVDIAVGKNWKEC